MMFLLFVGILGLVIIYFSIDTLVLKKTIDDSHSRIMDKINSVIDGVKTFFTVTLVDRISSAFGPEEPTEDDTEL